MSSLEISGVPIDRTQATIVSAEKVAIQKETASGLQETIAEAGNPFIQIKKQLAKIPPDERIKKMRELKTGLMPIQEIDKAAKDFQERSNQQWPEDTLKELHDRCLSELPTPPTENDVLNLIKEYKDDPTMIDLALEFLLGTIPEGDPRHEAIKKAKEALRKDKELLRKIKAGYNALDEAAKAAKAGLAATEANLNSYREFTGTQKDTATLFQEYSVKYNLAGLKKLFNFLFHALGADLTSGGPSIPPGKLHALMTETRSLQAILGVYRFFQKTTPLMERLFHETGAPKPSELTVENEAKAFMRIVQAYHPSVQDVQSAAQLLHIDNNIQGEIIVMSCMQRAVREVSLRIYNSSSPAAAVEHRNAVWEAITEFLNLQEDELSAIEDQQNEPGV